jgi:glucose/arabinose dehydrogenase
LTLATSHRLFIMLRLLLALFICTSVRIAAAEENTLSESEKRGGWKLLFDGKTTDGWRNYKQKGIGDGWKVEDGALTRAANGAGDILTADKYGSFELSIEYKISKAGNSGIMFHVTEDNDTPWMSGPEIQVQDNVDGHDPQKAGWLYQLYPANPQAFTNKESDATRPVGEWNQIVVRITPAGCGICLNGYQYSSFNVGNDDWNRRVAKSKFAAFPNFGKATEGYLCLQDHGDKVAYRNIKVRELPADGIPPNPVDGDLPLKVVPAFPNLQWTGWNTDDSGRVEPFRPILLTNFGDGTNRVVVPSQQGVIHVFPNDASASKTEIFADISDRVSYKDSENEEGLLGLAFHPKYKENGEFFVYYTSSKLKPHTCVLSRFRVSKADANKADASFEEELLRVTGPYWNHKGGTITFGPDGLLYIVEGDGGAGNDPHDNGQNTNTLLGKILRIDVDHKDPGKQYSIPKDNPFAGKADHAQEIYAYGMRNPWRIAFDKKTGLLWCADVGQNLWEEIDLIEKGGNYGWSRREGFHQFGPKPADPKDFIDPIWEYDHQVGKSITGGFVYRGKKLPELDGYYLYADYVTGKVWALKYDEKAKKVVSNKSIPSDMMPIVSFGEDEQGEAYLMMVTVNGKGLFTFAKAD